MAGCFEVGSELLGSIKCREFPDQLLQTDSGIWSYFAFFNILPRKAFSVLGCWASKYVLLVSAYYIYLESCLYFLLALSEACVFHFATQPSILTTAKKDPVKPPTFCEC
jgi:hypothetical protein